MWRWPPNVAAYRVEVVQTNVFYFEADNPEQARQIAAEDFLWDEDQDSPNSYGVHFNIFQIED